MDDYKLFRTQWFDDPNVSSEIRKERRKWTPKEDVVLISAWLNTSKDPVIGNEQKAEAFWKRIQGFFNSSPHIVGMQPREAMHCKHRWSRINDQVCKFVGCYEAAWKVQSSGQNDNDVMKSALDIFYNDYKAKFTLEHAWRELRHDQKWASVSSAKDGAKSKRRKLDSGSAQSSSSFPDSNAEAEPMGRPVGVKAAKSKGKTSKTSNELLEFQSMWAIKQQDMAMREKLSKHKMLETLLAKEEPLSEIDLALKNKLINELF